MRRTLVLVVAALAMPAVASAQEREFTFRERVSAGAWLRIHTIQGDIRVIEGSGDRAEVIGRKHGDDMAELAISTVRDGENVTICAVWEGGQCDAEGISSSRKWSRGGEASADFEIRLPRGVRIRAISGNGEVMVSGATAEVHASSGNGNVSVASSGGPVTASSGNGDIDVSEAGGEVTARSGNGNVNVATTRGPVSAYSGNGNIEARMDAVAGTEDMSFRTGNGDVTVMLPANFEGEIEARLPNGRLESDFPLRIEGRLDPRRLRATIGRGGRRITIMSGSGGAEIRKAG
jgi:Putative adhesin